MKRVLKNVIKRAVVELASLITFSRTSLIKFNHNTQRMSDSFYRITESSEFNWK